jgi:hypothetical protein
MKRQKCRGAKGATNQHLPKAKHIGHWRPGKYETGAKGNKVSVKKTSEANHTNQQSE